ncbi:MAG TPA: MFS transporter [Candidatus Limnocylindrales bacterium]|nr:MFS transporter [Candidatus Limnocylindrales bacterium]
MAARAGGWRASSWFLVATLTIVNTINWADRQVVPILFPGIQEELELSDTELGVIGGLSFSVIYAVSAFVFGYLADRVSRKLIILLGLISWSLATAAGGLATGFWTLFSARFFTGIGEASLYPCAMSLLTDRFAAVGRGRAVGMFGAAAAIGGGLGIGLGGRLAEIMGWREVFFLYGGAGLLLIPLVMLMEEPARPDHAPETEVSIGRTIVEALRDPRLHAVWGTGTLMMASAIGWVAWVPTYFVRDLGFDMTQTGLLFGVAQLFGGVIGSVIGGRLGDAYRARRVAGQLDVSAVAALISAPLLAVPLLELPTPVLIASSILGPMAIFAYFPNLQTAVAEIVPPRRLGLTFAVHVLFLGGIGSSIGPFVVGGVSDLTGGDLRLALFVPIVGMLLAAPGATWAGRVIRARAQQAG